MKKIGGIQHHKFDCQCYFCKTKRGENARKNNGMYGKKHKQSSIDKMRQARKNNPHIHKPNCQCFICKAKRGETKGKNNPFYGHTQTIESINKTRKANQKRFENLEERKKVGTFIKKWIKKNGHPKGMLNKHHTQESKDKIISTKLKKYNTLNFRTKETNNKMLKTRMKRYGKLNFFTSNTYSRCKRGWKTVGNKRYFFRSKWEKNYACYLEWLKNKNEIKDWRFETKTFWFENIKRGIRSYLPDFEVVTKKEKIEYHEVKGWMDAKSKTKLKRMAKYYPKIKMVLIDSEQYNLIKKWSTMIPDWED